MDPSVSFEARHGEPEQGFLRVICHEFRTPIASVEALARAMRRRPSSLGVEEQAEVLRLIEDHARHLSAMLDSVRVVAEHLPAVGDTGPRTEPVRLCDVVAGAGWAAGLDGRVRIDIDPAVVDVRIDVPKVRRILTNLFENAWVHGREPVTLRARRRVSDLELLVADRGAGLPKRIAARVFGNDVAGDGATGLDPRHGQAEAEPAAGPDPRHGLLEAVGAAAPDHAPRDVAGRAGQNATGSGLGLWIVAQLVAVLGGSVEAVASTPLGPGVQVLLPLSGG